MHCTNKELEVLAHAYVAKNILNDKQLKTKIHMRECDACYERFCCKLAVFKILKKNGFVEESMLEQTDKLCLIIRNISGKLNVINQIHEKAEAAYWEFVYRPKLAVGRGTEKDETKDTDIYVCKASEYSCIKRENGRIIIQLDEEMYQAEHLMAVYMSNGNEVKKPFRYDEDLECYVADIMENEIDDGEIQIICTK